MTGKSVDGVKAGGNWEDSGKLLPLPQFNRCLEHQHPKIV